MSKLSSMLKSVKIPSFADIKAKFSKTSRSTDPKAVQNHYINICEESLSAEFKELQLFGQKNKTKIELIENYSKLYKKKGSAIGGYSSSDSDKDIIIRYMALVGLISGRGALYKKVYENYNKCITDQFSVKLFMKFFSKEVHATKDLKDLEKLDAKIKERIAYMRVFLEDISKLLDNAHAVASRCIKEIEEYNKLGKKAWPRIKEQLLKELDDMLREVEPIIKKQNDNLGEMFHRFSEDLSTDKNINLVELFLSKNKDNVSSYAQIMKYSKLIGNYKGAVEYFNKKVDTVELTATANESAGFLKAILNAKKAITGADTTKMSDMDKCSFYQRLVNELQSKRNQSLAASHDLITKKSQKMQELRDKILLVANEAAKEIEELKIERSKGKPTPRLSFEGLDIGIRMGNVSSLRNKFEDMLRDQQARGVTRGKK